jgi:hypothetical protein
MKKQNARTLLKEYSHFYCEKCKATRPLKDKPEISETKGPYVLIKGDFVCAHCGFRKSADCENCQIQPVEIEEPYMENVDGRFLGGDVLCSNCRLIIGTLFKPNASHEGKSKTGGPKNTKVASKKRSAFTR